MVPEQPRHNGTNKNKSAIDSDQLATFCDVYISKNFTQSAANLGITESTVSYRIRELEKFFEKRLFNRRSNKTLEPTEFGISFFPDAQNILTIVRRHKNIDSEGQLSGNIKISAGEIGGVYLLPPVIRAFESKFTNISINIGISNSLKTLKKLSESECDLGVTASIDFNPNPYLKNVEVTKLLKLTYGVIVPINHPLSKKKSLRATDLVGLPYISRDSYSGSHREILKIFAEGNISEEDLLVVWRFDNSSSVINAVTEGLGISIVNYVQASRYVQAGLLEFIPLDTKVESYLNLLDHWKGTNQIVNTFKNFLKYYIATTDPAF